jgi:hypothetical protein
LRADFKDAFREAIAASYSATHNMERARARLALLGDPDPVEALSAQAQRMLGAGEPFTIVQNVAGLASDLRSGVTSSQASATIPAGSAVASPILPGGTSTAATATYSSTQEATSSDISPTPPPYDTPTPRPTRTSVPTASAPFLLMSQDPVCNTGLTEGLMQVSVLDRNRHQMPGVEIEISWSGGEERFFTGLKPEIADGYADYVMQSGVTYSLRVAHSSVPVTGLSAPSCPDSGGQTYVGGLKLVFQQP